MPRGVGLFAISSSRLSVPAVISPYTKLSLESSPQEVTVALINSLLCALDQAKQTLEHTLVEGSGLRLSFFAPIISFDNKFPGFAGMARIVDTIASSQLTETTVRLFGWKSI